MKIRSLNSKSAIILFLCYVGSQALSGILAGAILAIYYALTNDSFDHGAFTDFLKNFTLPILVFSLLVSGILVIALSYKYGSGFFKDRSSTGIALHPGGVNGISAGFITGILTAFFYVVIAVSIYPPDPGMEPGDLTKMLLTPGPQRIFWIVLALIVAPVIEEYLFRGVMLAGLTYSIGLVKASIVVTVLFVSVHTFEAIHYPPAFGGIALIAVLVILLRLKYRALGPAIAAHFGYNLIIASAAILGS